MQNITEYKVEKQYQKLLLPEKLTIHPKYFQKQKYL